MALTFTLIPKMALTKLKYTSFSHFVKQHQTAIENGSGSE
jgi:hypothetical protein